MARGVAEHLVRPRRFAGRQRLRVDLHGVSVFGPGNHRTLIRWEWLEEIQVVDHAVVVRSATESITLPPGAFNQEAADLARNLEDARSIVRRPDVIGELADSATR